jgi:hypothetical protein
MKIYKIIMIIMITNQVKIMKIIILIQAAMIQIAMMQMVMILITTLVMI